MRIVVATVMSGVKTIYSEYEGMGHSFISMRASLDQGKRAMDLIVDTLRASL